MFRILNRSFQSLLFSSKLGIQAIKNNINELKNKFAIKENCEIILASSLNFMIITNIPKVIGRKKL